MAPIAFAVGLLAAGQSSTLTGTLAGQVVMEGFVNLRMRPWTRRLVTRLLAIVPAVITVVVFGADQMTNLLVVSQVVLSLQLPFAVVPLLHFTNERARMGEFANPRWVQRAGLDHDGRHHRAQRASRLVGDRRLDRFGRIAGRSGSSLRSCRWRLPSVCCLAWLIVRPWVIG